MTERVELSLGTQSAKLVNRNNSKMRDFFIELTDLTQTDVLNFCILDSVSFSSGNVRDFITV